MKPTLSICAELLAVIDRLAGSKISRSTFVESILRDSVDGDMRARRRTTETAAIDAHAAALNIEMRDVLSVQAGT